MPASPNSLFSQPDNLTAKLWRYMDFTKFVSLLHSSSLFFAAANHLGDPFEGSFTNKNVQIIKEFVEAHPETETSLVRRLENAKSIRSKILVNCWHVNEHESAAMWRLYTRSNETVAITTTFDTLQKLLPNEAYLGKVEYIDYENGGAIGYDSHLLPYIHKRLSYKHEEEVRAIIDTSKEVKGSNNETINAVGRKVKIDLAALIDEVYVAPTCPHWFLELVDDITKKYGLHVSVERSSLDNTPMF